MKDVCPHSGLDRLNFNMRRVGVPKELIGECQCGLMATLTQSTEVDIGWLRALDEECWPQQRELDGLSPNTWKG